MSSFFYITITTTPINPESSPNHYIRLGIWLRNIAPISVVTIVLVFSMAYTGPAIPQARDLEKKITPSVTPTTPTVAITRSDMSYLSWK